MSLFFNAVDDGYGGIMYTIKPLGTIAIVVVALLLVLLGCAIFGKNKKSKIKKACRIEQCFKKTFVILKNIVIPNYTIIICTEIVFNILGNVQTF